MGTTYSNCQVRSDSQDAVVKVLNGLLKAPAYVSPAVNGWVGVYPEEGGEMLARELSRRLSATVFDWRVYDSDIFYYALYEDGKPHDEFNSNPGWGTNPDDEFSPPPNDAEKARVHGNPKALLPYCVPSTTLAAVQEVLHPAELAEPALNAATMSPLLSEPIFHQMAQMLGTTAEALNAGIVQKSREKYVFADDQATDLAKLLGMDENLAASRFRDLEEGEFYDFSPEAFRLIGNENLTQEYKDSKLWSSPMRVEELRKMVALGADVNSYDRNGQPYILRAARYCSSEAMRFLIEAGADVNATTKEPQPFGWERGVTALMVAAGASIERPERLIETVQILLDAGADVNTRSEAGRAALGEALKMTDAAQHQGKIGRHAPEEVLRQAAARSAQVVEMLRAAGATE